MSESDVRAAGRLDRVSLVTLDSTGHALSVGKLLFTDNLEETPVAHDFNWECPHCKRAVTIGDGRMTVGSHILAIQNSVGRRSLLTRFIVCPNPECKKFTLTADLYESVPNQIGSGDKLIRKLQDWKLIPASSAKVYSSSIVPVAILDDYREACSICDLSPKASATLSRRCLQGILRNFWGVKPARLVDEIREVQPKIDALTWDAIEAVRKLGNIGAHMEKDINVIVDVDPDEAQLLIGLVETLIEEWYVARAERTAKMGALIAAAASKP